MTPDNDNLRRPGAFHHPLLPPAHPCFQPLIASIPRLIAREGSAATARRLRARLEVIRNDATPARLAKSGVSAFDVAELDAWLTHRINELEI